MDNGTKYYFSIERLHLLMRLLKIYDVFDSVRLRPSS